MTDRKAKILILVEGQKTDLRLMQFLLDIYGISERHEIVSYNTNLYVLYNALFESGDSEALDLLQVLKERENDPERRQLFEEYYSDILLIFDLDPHDSLYSEDKILRLLDFFNESSENGKLYINYPMVEAFYHMKTIPDSDYFSYTVSMAELHNKEYKARVQRESKGNDYSKFAITKEECSRVILQNIEKAKWMTSDDDIVANEIFKVQAEKIRSEGLLYVLSTCGFYIVDYNYALINQ